MDRIELLRSQAVHALQGAMGGLEVHMYGAEYGDATGVILDSKDSMHASVIFRERDENGEYIKYCYTTNITVSVNRVQVIE